MPPDLIVAGKVFDIMWLGVQCYGGSLTHLHQNPKRILAGSPRTKSSLLLILPTSLSSKIVPRDGFTFLAMGFSGARAAGFPGPSCVRKKTTGGCRQDTCRSREVPAWLRPAFQIYQPCGSVGAACFPAAGALSAMSGRNLTDRWRIPLWFV